MLWQEQEDFLLHTSVYSIQINVALATINDEIVP